MRPLTDRPPGSVTDRFSKVAGLPIRLRNALMPVMGPISYKKAYGPLRLTG